MAVLSKTQYKAQYGSTGSIFPDNTTEEISEADMRQFGEDTADSFNSVLESNTVESWKSPCAVATTANMTLSGEQTIDGVLTSASRVLVKNQTTQSQNGIYVSAAGAWSRATDADAAAELEGAAVGVTQGTTQQNTVWLQTSDNITLGSTAIAWQQIGFGFSGITGTTGTTDNAILRADGTGGSTVQSSAVTISDAGRIQNVTDPTSAQDAATKNYVDSLPSTISELEVDVSSAELLNLNSVPKQLIAAPGSNRVIIVHFIYMKYTFVTAAYATNTDLRVRYANGPTTILDYTAIISQSADRQTLRNQMTITATTDISNSEVNVTILNGNPTAGSGTLKFIIKYQTIDVS